MRVMAGWISVALFVAGLFAVDVYTVAVVSPPREAVTSCHASVNNVIPDPSTALFIDEPTSRSGGTITLNGMVVDTGSVTRYWCVYDIATSTASGEFLPI